MIPDEVTLGPAPYPYPTPPAPPPARPAPKRLAWLGALTPFVAWLALVLSSAAVAPHVPAVLRPHPKPAPAPGPAPAPVPKPAYLGPLYGVFVVPDPEDGAAAALAVDPLVRNAMDARSAVWRAFKADSAEGKAYAKYTAPPSDPPCVLWLRDDGSLIRVTKPATRASVLSDLGAIRGQ